MKKKLFFTCWVLALAGSPIWSQDRKASEKEPQDAAFSYVLADVSFVSDAVFMGRRDTVAAPYLLPSLGYYHKSGFFADASLSYLVAEGEGRVDLFLLTAGYAFGKNRLSGGISGTAYFFNEASYNVKSETVGDLTGLVGYDWGPLETSLSLSAYFNSGDSPDFFTGVMLSRDLVTSDKQWMFRPSVSAYAGTQYFYEAYYNTSRLGNRKGSGRGTGSAEPVNQTLSLAEVEKFKLLNLEVSLPIHFFTGHFIFSATPSLAFPQSPATVTGTDQDFTEELDPSFYFMAGLSYWF